MKRLSVVFQSRHSAPFSAAHCSKIWKSSLLLHIFLWRDMKWAHIINISIRFDCTPNKSNCSNKHRALLLCLTLSGFKLLTLHLTIYYRHLSLVTDKHCDGCRILLCQNGFISPLQATISTELMSWAYSLSPNLLSFPLPFHSSLRWQPLSLILKKNPFHQEQMYSIIYWFSYLCTLFCSLQFICQCLCVCLSAPARTYRCRWVYKHMHLCVCMRCAHSIWAEHDCVLTLMLFHIVILCSRCNILLFRNPTINHLNYCWQTSKRFRLAAHFLSISNTQVDRITECCVFVCVRVAASVIVEKLSR